MIIREKHFISASVYVPDTKLCFCFVLAAKGVSLNCDDETPSEHIVEKKYAKNTANFMITT